MGPDRRMRRNDVAETLVLIAFFGIAIGILAALLTLGIGLSVWQWPSNWVFAVSAAPMAVSVIAVSASFAVRGQGAAGRAAGPPRSGSVAKGVPAATTLSASNARVWVGIAVGGLTLVAVAATWILQAIR